jgi:hypothetical protein
MLPAAGVSSAPPNFLAVLAVVVLSVLNRSRCAGCKPSWNWHRRCLGAWHKNQAKCESEDSACNGPRHIHSLPFDYSFARYQYHMRFHGIAYLRARQAIQAARLMADRGNYAHHNMPGNINRLIEIATVLSWPPSRLNWVIRRRRSIWFARWGR